MSTSKVSVGTTGTFNLVYGHGSVLGEVGDIGGNEMPWKIEKRDDEYCVIKESTGESEGCHVTEEAAKKQMAALYASEDKEVTEKAGSASDYLVVEDPDKPSTWHLPVKRNGKPDHNLMGAAWAALHSGYRGNKYEGPNKAEAISKLRALYKSEGMEVPGDKSDDTDHLFVYKSADGSYRWASISSVAIKDKEFEVVTESAYDDAIQHAIDTGEFGELDLVHVDGTDVGDCDFMARAGKRLVEGGPFYSTPRAIGAAEAISTDPEYWGVSIKFVYDPSKFDGEKYHGNIRIRKRSILPQEMAASFGTKLVAIGGERMKNEMSDKTRDALVKLNIPEEEIESLAEKQLEGEPEPNTVEKEVEESTGVTEEVVAVPEKVEVEKSTWERLKEVVSNLFTGMIYEPDAEAGSEEEKEVEPVEAQEETKEAAITVDDLHRLAEAISAPLIAKMKESEEAYMTKVASLEARLKEAERAVEDKVISKLVDLPQVVKVRASETEATAVTEESPRGPVLPQASVQPSENYVSELMKGVTAAVEQGIRDALPNVQI